MNSNCGSIHNRYGGIYSGGRYTAWYSDIPNTPSGIYGDDVTCAKAWGKLRAARQNGKLVYGVGKTPDEALHDLAIAMMTENNNNYSEICTIYYISRGELEC